MTKLTDINWKEFNSISEILKTPISKEGEAQQLTELDLKKINEYIRYMNLMAIAIQKKFEMAKQRWVNHQDSSKLGWNR